MKPLDNDEHFAGNMPVFIVDYPFYLPGSLDFEKLYRVGTKNFTAVLRYNSSYFYAGAVAELGSAIAEMMGKRGLINFEAKSKDAAPQSTVTEDTGIATIAQYESPYGSGRSVVAILGDGQDGSYLLNKRLMNPGDLKMVGGGVAIFKPNAQPASYMVGPDYYTGSIRTPRSTSPVSITLHACRI